jgi:hypothetical protein
MGKRKYQDVGAVDSVVIEHVWEALKTNTVEPITKDLPSVGMGRNPFHGLVHLFSKFEPQPGTAALVPKHRPVGIPAQRADGSELRFQTLGGLPLFF